jgi:hypothetical protein
MVSKLLSFLICISLPSSFWACTVTIEGEDKTSEFFITGEDGVQFVDCQGPSKCENAQIVGCPIIKCAGTEACHFTQILEFTEHVRCDGLHSCHFAEIVGAEVTQENEEGAPEQTVSCLNGLACAKAHIVGKGGLTQVTCKGIKACRKTAVSGSKRVKCQDGAKNASACLNAASFETECLYCGYEGCEKRINQCRYRIPGGDEKYAICPQEAVTGTCPEGWEAELKLELSEEIPNEEEIEDGIRKQMLRG